MNTTEMPVHMYFLLDRSGSMRQFMGDVIGGFNAWLAEQKAKPGECRFTFVQFDSDNPFEVVHDAVRITDVPDLNDEIFQPRGLTPLLDAEGRLMTKATERVALRASADAEPEAILVVTYTDGMENYSSEWSFEQVVKMKKEKEAVGWAFAYLGVGHDAYLQAAMIGTNAAATKSFAGNAAGVRAAYSSVSQVANNFRDNANRGHTTDSANLYVTPDEPLPAA